MGRMAEIAHAIETFGPQPDQEAPSTLAQIIEQKAARAWLEIAELEELQRAHPDLFIHSTAADVLSMSLKLEQMRKRLETRRVAA